MADTAIQITDNLLRKQTEYGKRPTRQLLAGGVLGYYDKAGSMKISYDALYPTDVKTEVIRGIDFSSATLIHSTIPFCLNLLIS